MADTGRRAGIAALGWAAMRPARVLPLIAAGIVTAAAAATVWARYRLVAITVEGMSMSPALFPGDRVLLRRGTGGVKRGRIVVLSRPRPVTGWRDLPPAGRDLAATDWYIKRVVALPGDAYPPQLHRRGTVPPDHIVVLGDHPHSEDSKQHGAVPVNQVLGVMLRHLPTEQTVAEALPHTRH